MLDAVPALPWEEISALLPAGQEVLVMGGDAALDVPLAQHWSRLPDGAQAATTPRHGPVLLIDPRSAAEVRAAHSLAGDEPVVVVIPNLAQPALLLAMLTGGGDEVAPGSMRAGMPRRTVDEIAAALGRRCRQEQRPHAGSSGRPLEDLLTTIGLQSGGQPGPWLVRTYDVAEVPPPAQNPPSLSVLIRTQGQRPSSLAEVLLCLSAQTCEDFEVLILAHDVSPEAMAVLTELVEAHPRRFSRRVRVLPVEGGGRSRPLIVGIEHAEGDYLAILDDDDLVLGHWVETFRIGSEHGPGQIIRTLCVEQDVHLVAGDPAYRSASWPVRRWDEQFSLISHVVDNHSPIHSYAYPRAAFARFGFRFDESLPVLEDWDLLVRAASVLGVHDAGEVTAVYRRWPSSSSSFAELPEDHWPRTAWQVVAGWDRSPLLLPAGSAARLRRDGIAILRHRPLGPRVRDRLARERDRWAPRLRRTPLFGPLRWVYRRFARRLDSEA